MRTGREQNIENALAPPPLQMIDVMLCKEEKFGPVDPLVSEFIVAFVVSGVWGCSILVAFGVAAESV